MLDRRCAQGERMSDWYKKMTISETSDPVWENFLSLKEQIQSDEFWFDAIRKNRNDNTERLKLALKNLPLPAAFSEAAKAIRTSIRELKKHKEDYSEMLTKLYKLACVRSFMLDYAPLLKQPGFNVMLSIPGGALFNLRTEYNEIGIEKLELLTMTDRKMIIECWGSTNANYTMNELYSDIWEKAEEAMCKKENRRIKTILRKT